MAKITFVGNEMPKTERIVTGFRSFDLAVGNKKDIGHKDLGFPIRTVTEWYGRPGIGKTTVMLSIGGLIANELGGHIAFADFEGQSYDTVANALELSGYVGEMNLLRDSESSTHVDVLDNMISQFKTKECNVALLDSVGAFMPPGEIEGSVADANMGKKAFIIGNWIRGMVNILMSKKGVCMYITHQHSNLGFVGTHTSGGETKNFMNALQIELRQKDVFTGGWMLEGTVKKNRYGKKDETFILFVIGGRGVHKGLTAVFECINLGIAEIERKVVRMDGESYGKIDAMIEHYDDDSLFAPFHNALIAYDISYGDIADNEEIVAEELPKKATKRGRKPKKK